MRGCVSWGRVSCWPGQLIGRQLIGGQLIPVVVEARWRRSDQTSPGFLCSLGHYNTVGMHFELL